MWLWEGGLYFREWKNVGSRLEEEKMGIPGNAFETNDGSITCEVCSIIIKGMAMEMVQGAGKEYAHELCYYKVRCSQLAQEVIDLKNSEKHLKDWLGIK